jgi:hypothetical protein
MTTRRDHPGVPTQLEQEAPDAAATGEALERDRRFEALLDELVASDDPLAPVPPADLTDRIVAGRPFAPWEVRQARFWRFPLVAGAGLIGGSAGLFLAPLWRLGPATALQLWASLSAAAIASPLQAALAAGPLLAEAMGKVSGTFAGRGLVLLGLGTLIAASGLALGLGRPARQSARALAR